MDQEPLASDGLPYPPEMRFDHDPVNALERAARYWSGGYFEVDEEASRRATLAAQARVKNAPPGGWIDPRTGNRIPRLVQPGFPIATSYRLKPDALRAMREGREYVPEQGAEQPAQFILPPQALAWWKESQQRRLEDRD
jgi:hypothetical protein